MSTAASSAKCLCSCLWLAGFGNNAVEMQTRAEFDSATDEWVISTPVSHAVCLDSIMCIIAQIKLCDCSKSPKLTTADPKLTAAF